MYVINYFENVSYTFRKILILPKIPGQVIRESVFRTKFYFEKHIQCVFILEPNFRNHFTNEVLRSLYSLPDDSCLRVNALRRDPLSAEMYTTRSLAIFMKYTRSIHTIFWTFHQYLHIPWWFFYCFGIFGTLIMAAFSRESSFASVMCKIL